MDLLRTVPGLDFAADLGFVNGIAVRGNWAADQKVRWAARHFPGTRIITTAAREKRKHGKPGDVLVDDQLKHAGLWEEMGGIFIHHRSNEATLEALAAYFPL